MSWSYPSYEEWFSSLPDAERQRTLKLVARFRAAGCKDPEAWTRSEVSQNIAQYARLLFLRDFWPQYIDKWSQNPHDWIEKACQSAAAQPRGFFADAGHAMAKMRAAGISDADIAAVARMTAYSTAFRILDRIDEGYYPAVDNDDPGWVLMERDHDGNLTGRQVSGLHEDLLMLDPSGRDGGCE
jgi:hypothetical protein